MFKSLCIDVDKIKSKLKYLVSIQKEYPKKEIIQHQISFLHSILEFYYSNGINASQLGIYHSNGNYNYLLEELPNADMQRFIRKIRQNYMDIDFWNKFTTSPYRRGNRIDIDVNDKLITSYNKDHHTNYTNDDICVDSPILIKYIERLSNIGEINLHIINDNLFIQEFPLKNDNSDDDKYFSNDKYFSVIKDIPISIEKHQFDALMKYSSKSFKYINTSVNESHVMIGYDESELVFEYNVTTDVMKNYTTQKLTLEYSKTKDENLLNDVQSAENNNNNNAWLFKSKKNKEI